MARKTNTGKGAPVTWQRVLIVLMAMGLIAASSGSIRATGGGWIETEDGDRAVFSVVAECEEPDTPSLGASGIFMFRDRSEGIAIRGTIVDCNTGWGEGEEGVLNLNGIYKTSTGDIALIDIALFDRETDILHIGLEADGLSYHEAAELGGGNIRIDWPG